MSRTFTAVTFAAEPPQAHTLYQLTLALLACKLDEALLEECEADAPTALLATSAAAAAARCDSARLLPDKHCHRQSLKRTSNGRVAVYCIFSDSCD